MRYYVYILQSKKDGSAYITSIPGFGIPGLNDITKAGAGTLKKKTVALDIS